MTAIWRCSEDRTVEGNPLVGIDDSGDGALEQGVVLERIGAGSYTYLRLRSLDDDTERWAVVLGRGAEPGERVSVTHFGTRRDFHSRRLDRTFDRLDFVMISNLED